MKKRYIFLVVLILLNSGCIFSDEKTEPIGEFSITIYSNTTFEIIVPIPVNLESDYSYLSRMFMLKNESLRLVIIDCDEPVFHDLWNSSLLHYDDYFFSQNFFGLKISGSGSNTIRIFHKEYQHSPNAITLSSNYGKNFIYTDTNINVSISGKFSFSDSKSSSLEFNLDKTALAVGWNEVPGIYQAPNFLKAQE